MLPISTADPERFRTACEQVTAADRRRDSIGTLSEKTLHAVLKRYYEPDHDRHEIPVGSYVADIVGEDGIIEIQTRSFSKLRPKLTAFLDVAHVTVVYPIIVEKTVISIDETTGEWISKRKSPKKGNLYTAVPELYTLRELLPHPRLTLRLPLLTANEIRRFGVRTRRRKKQRTRRGEYVSDLIPTDLLSEKVIAAPQDYTDFIPCAFREGHTTFTAAAFSEEACVDVGCGRRIINLLVKMGLVEAVGQQGRAKLYRVNPQRLETAL